MIWRIFYAVLGFTFLATGYTVMTDASCHSVSLSGIRAIEVTCNAKGTSFSPLLVGLVSLIIGLVVIAVNLGIFLQEIATNRIARNKHNDYIDAEVVTNLEEKAPDALGKGITLVLKFSPLLFLAIIIGTFVVREIHIHQFSNVMKDNSICGEFFQASSDFNQQYKSANDAQDSNAMLNAFNTASSKLADYSKSAGTKLKTALIDDANAYANVATAAQSGSSNSLDIAVTAYKIADGKVFAICSP